MFSVVPKVIWEKTNPPDEKNRIEMAANAILIDDGKKKILVETGCGDKIDSKFRDIFAIEKRTVVAGLADAGYSPEDVDDVICTHLHFDHGGGNTVIKNGVAAPTFPNSKYHFQHSEWEWARNPSLRDKASYLPDNFAPLEPMGVLVLHDGEKEIHPGITLLPTPGHNQGHQSVLIRSKGETAIFLTDLCPTSSHLNLPFIMSYDLFPLKIMETKKRIFDRAVKEGWIVCFYHDPKVYYGKVKYNDKGRVVLKEEVFGP